MKHVERVSAVQYVCYQSENTFTTARDLYAGPRLQNSICSSQNIIHPPKATLCIFCILHIVHIFDSIHVCHINGSSLLPSFIFSVYLVSESWIFSGGGVLLYVSLVGDVEMLPLISQWVDGISLETGRVVV